LEHSFSDDSIYGTVRKLIEKNGIETCNLKILLIGGRTKEEASIYILALNPLFPDKKLYRDGVKCITYHYERTFPHAKTLSMLGSYLAYRKAKHAGAYDALLINRDRYITESTRTNFFCIQGKTIVSPREEDILPGITRKVLMRVASENGYTIKEGRIALSNVKQYDGAFLTSTSSKLLPVRAIDGIVFPVTPTALRELMILFDAFLEHTNKSS